jgi:hypothetical protein
MEEETEQVIDLMNQVTQLISSLSRKVDDLDIRLSKLESKESVQPLKLLEVKR